MRFSSIALLILLYVGLISKALGQEKLIPKREFRGVWIATVVNIDWPSSSRISVEKQKEELVNTIEAHFKSGLNAIVLQVRPASDALYAKSREPWSAWLTGQQGKAPEGNFDPLEFAINESHKRGMEVHAWFNPYRATFDTNFAKLSSAHITNQQPDWFFTYQGKKLFNPGLPEVRDYIIQVVMDVVKNYDVDGIHFDDYFYPYPVAKQRINDDRTFRDNNNGFEDIKDWRRNNVDILIRDLGDSIHAQKPWVKYGISPFGIWKNKAQDPDGSASNGGSSFYEQFADSKKWVEEGWIDYINPQIYWPFGYRAAPFEKMVDWWSENTFGRHLYIGQGAYQVFNSKHPSWQLKTQLPDQVKYLRDNPRVQGSVYFSSNSLIKNPLGFTDSLKSNYYRHFALPPAMLWRDSIPPRAPQNLEAEVINSKVKLTWETPATAKDNEPVFGYVIYRFNDEEDIILDNPKNILRIIYTTDTTYEDASAEQGLIYRYVITALDRIKNESFASNPISITLD
jgi:uncharacterized lipoprotein YddW (UPF0748 family)